MSLTPAYRVFKVCIDLEDVSATRPYSSGFLEVCRSLFLEEHVADAPAYRVFKVCIDLEDVSATRPYRTGFLTIHCMY